MPQLGYKPTKSGTQRLLSSEHILVKDYKDLSMMKAEILT